ncbi:carboxypeptidase-like regulatory domain-containing protein [Mucilaginibacter sp. UR6-1]|uniref:carboxypeptidase-like regulatory domain-containing protein n=1 Tax=Mucilaginibacter sp. UR6-1 TaxID=1435643 RepID=UPI001E428622|nr:carboxypeptidase-like regulatory domain-containing protein [Mucilaginibacter sp. UR6-1]MCC8407314.1 carboxypeptidase-like regulatory domain-containing protein [Mucilaginibacter sp. UR6-1]
MKKALLTFTFLLFSVITYAQFTIAGKVLNAADKKPVESATVFVNNTSYGTKTDKEGNFIIRDVQAGQYDLIISVVGFKTQKASVTVKANVTVPPITITEREFELNEVKITRSKGVDNKYLEIFKREILGSSRFGRQCRIINPKVIELSYDKAVRNLTGYTSDFMVIDNKLLGYRVKYLVEDFERNETKATVNYVGYVLFEEMKGTEKERSEWYVNRLEAYNGSPQHFFRALLGNNINRAGEPGFLVLTMTRTINPRRLPDSLIMANIRYYSERRSGSARDSMSYWLRMQRIPRRIQVMDTTRLKAQDVVQLTDQSGLYALKIDNTNYLKIWKYVKVPGMSDMYEYKCDTCDYTNSLYVTYTKKVPALVVSKNRVGAFSTEKTFTPTAEMGQMASVITPTETVFFDRNGMVVNPMSLRMEGYWEKQRVGDLLPVDYLPNTGVVSNAPSVSN